MKQRTSRPLQQLAVDDYVAESHDRDWLNQEPQDDVDTTSVDVIFRTDNLDEGTNRGYGTL